jgi:RDD family
MALSLQVADASGKRMSFGRATLRYVTKTVFTALTLGIAFLVAIFTERHQALYDIVAGTIVIPRGAHVVQSAEAPLGLADPTAVEILRGRVAAPIEAKSPMSGKRFDRALAALSRVAEPGERPVAAANALFGPSPLVVHLLLGSLGRFLLLKSTLLWITDRRVVLIRLSNWTGRPKGVLFAEPRSNVTLFRAESRTLWLRRPDGTEYRLNQVRKAEARWISQALGGPIV